LRAEQVKGGVGKLVKKIDLIAEKTLELKIMKIYLLKKIDLLPK
jgi:hypothetical protein